MGRTSRLRRRSAPGCYLACVTKPLGQPGTSTYRDELAAARARIAALEDELSSLRAAGQPIALRRLRRLEVEYEAALADLGPAAARRAALRAGLVPLVLFALIGLLAVLLDRDVETLAATTFVGVWIGTIVALMRLGIHPRSARKRVEKLEAEIEAARGASAPAHPDGAEIHRLRIEAARHVGSAEAAADLERSALEEAQATEDAIPAPGRAVGRRGP